jgi:predicted ATPase
VAGRARPFRALAEALLGAVRAGGLPQAPTLDAVLPALLGRLLPEWAGDARRVLEAAAVLGRRFDWTLLPAVTGLDERGWV